MNRGPFHALAIGGSAGSLPVICTLLEALDRETELAVVICMHVGTRDVRGLCEVLSHHCALPVVEAEDGAPVAAATVHVAVGDYHLLVERDHVFALCAGERVQYARPRALTCCSKPWPRRIKRAWRACCYPAPTPTARPGCAVFRPTAA